MWKMKLLFLYGAESYVISPRCTWQCKKDVLGIVSESAGLSIRKEVDIRIHSLCAIVYIKLRFIYSFALFTM